MKEFFRSLSLRSIIMIFCSSFIVLVILVSAVFYMTGVRHMGSLIRRNADDMTRQAAQNLERKLEQLKDSSTHSITDSYLFSRMNRNMQDNLEPISAKHYTELARSIQTFVNQNNQDISIVILMLSNNSIVLTASYYDEIYRCRQPDYQELFEKYSNNRLDWTYKDTVSGIITNPKLAPEIGLIQMLGNADSDVQGFLYIGIANESVVKDLTYYHVTEKNIFTLLKDGTFVFQDSGKPILEQEFAGDYIFRVPLKIDPLEVVAILPKEELFLDSDRFSALVLAEALAAVVLCCILFAVVTKLISAPAEKLARQLNSVETLTQLEAVQPTGGKDFEQITDAINHLYASLTAEIHVRKDAQLQSLYAQINPHFLYNTLDSIGQLCEMGEMEAAYRMVHELSDFYRIGVSKGENLIPLRDELLHVTSYLSILQTRFEDFHFEVDVPDELLGIIVPKIILQPLAENSVYHGIRSVKEDGCIRICACVENGNVIISLEDDGIGIEEDRLEEIRTTLQEGYQEKDREKHPEAPIYGLKNVHRRIMLQYGEGYGLSIDSEPEAGTVVAIRIPYQVEGGEEPECLKYYS